MSSKLLPRIITSVVLIPLVILAIFYLPFYFFAAVLALIILLAGLEMANMFWPKSSIKQYMFVFLLLVLFILSQLLNPLPILVIAALFWLLGIPLLLMQYSKTGKNYLQHGMSKVGFGILVFVPCFAGFMELWHGLDKFLVLTVLLLVWAADIGAYFVGIRFGKHKLAPKLSPKKSVEGVFGGVGLALLVAVIVGWFKFHLTLSNWPIWLLLVLVVVLWSVLGDLTESMLKRTNNIKDSGGILPGHGGIYDRIDSLTVAVPLFALGLLLLGL